MRLHPSRPVAVTGAAGKTGRALIAALLKRGETIRALVRNAEQGEVVRAIGAQELVIGDMRDETVLEHLLKGCASVYHICPNMHPDEVAIGRALLNAMERVRQRSTLSAHLVYHSVLRPQIEAMPHHWAKLRVEEMILARVSPFTILQPAPYYQNILTQRMGITLEGRYLVPYGEWTNLAMVDLVDVAEVAARLIAETEGVNGVYELVGANWRQDRLADALGGIVGRPVRVGVTGGAEWERAARARGMGEYAVTTLMAMFRYYETSGLCGNPAILRMLLGRDPTTLEEFAQREFGIP